MKRFNEDIVSMLIETHKKLSSKKQISAFISSLQERCPGMTRDIFYRLKKERATDNRTFKPNRKDKGIPRRKNGEKFLQEIEIIASIMMASSLNEKNDFKFFRNKKFNPTELARDIAFGRGLVSERYPISTINFWFRKLGLNMQSVFQEIAKIHLVADHSNHVWLVDATPLQSIYLREDNRIAYHPEIGIDKSHGSDILRRKKLRKVWLYFVVDKFSGAFDIYIYADVNLGENPLDWVKSICESMKPSDDRRNPIQGIPLNIYGDGGALNNATIEGFGKYFGIQIDWHNPGNSAAKGGVEGRISAYKRRIETLFNSACKPSERHGSKLVSLREFAEDWKLHINQKYGLYDKYRNGLPTIELVTDEHINSSLQAPTICTVNNHGEIRFGGKTYFVDWEVVGMKLEVSDFYPDIVRAFDPVTGQRYECTEDLNTVTWGTFKSPPKSEKRRLQEIVLEKAKEFKLNTSIDDLMPDNIYRIKNENHELYSKTKAWEQLLKELRVVEEFFSEDIKSHCLDYFQACLENHNSITSSDLQELKSRIQKHINLQKEQNQ